MPAEIKACPFPSCKGEGYLAEEEHWTGAPYSGVVCETCGSRGPVVEGPHNVSGPLAIERWNGAPREEKT